MMQMNIDHLNEMEAADRDRYIKNLLDIEETETEASWTLGLASFLGVK